MRPFRGVLGVCALVLLGARAEPTQAAWDNVFQACCASCGGQQPAVSGYAPSAGCCPQTCCPPAPTCCTTQYVQRCYYQPVTCYQTKTYYEPVTTYRTSYYYEPVTSYRYSCYCDPCTGCCQQMACPTTCYRLRSQCCAVQSWVQRCCQVPVTSYRQSFYWEPVTTCCTPSCTPCSASVPAAAPSQVPPAVTEQSGAAPTQAPPTVTEQRMTPVPKVTEQYQYQQQPPAGTPGTIPGGTSSYRQLPPLVPARPRTLPPAPPPTVRLDRIVSVPGGNGQVQGQVVRNDQTPRANAQLMFVSISRQTPQQSVTADGKGAFRVSLTSGEWLVYVHGTDGKPVFHSKIDVKGDENRQLTLVSR